MTSLSPREAALGIGPSGASLSLSGRERNRFFASRAGRGFVDLSYLAGVDAVEDGRVFARADLDHDGDDEIILVSRNAPVLRIYENRIADGKRFVGVRVSGRDPVGVTSRLNACGRTIRRDVDGGAGFATRNASTLTIGLGDCASADAELTFPSGEKRALGTLAAGKLYEVSAEVAEVPEFYSVRRRSAQAAEASSWAQTLLGAPAHVANIADGANPRYVPQPWRPTERYAYVALWASWCAACRDAEPELEALAARLEGRAAFVEVSIEAEDAPQIVAEHPGRIIPKLALAPNDAAAFIAGVRDAFGGELPALPSGLLVDLERGAILTTRVGVPTYSELALHLPEARAPLPAPASNDVPTWVWIAAALIAVGVWMLGSGKDD